MALNDFFNRFDDNEIPEQLAIAWLSMERASSGSDRYFEIDSYVFEDGDALFDACFHKPDLSWESIKITAEMMDEQKEKSFISDYDIIISNLGSGPLQDLLEHHGENFIDRIIDCAGEIPGIKLALQYIDESGFSQIVSDKLESLRREHN